MKKTFLKFMMAASVLGTVMTSCNSDDDANTNTCSDGIKNGDETGVDCGGSSCQPCALAELEGELSNELTLDASIAYELKGKFEVLDGGKLTIPAGTVIKATGGTASYIAVAQGGQIFVNGTASNPVVMTSGETAPEAGNWGGLVVCGNAPTNKGASVTSEVAGLTYGGTATDDNSGSIRYLRLEYTGAEFSADKQFNGLSLFGVGSGTTVEYVQSYNGKDDGIEFFGGTVNGKYLVSTNAGDDGIDFADGWNGNGEFWY
ncbi:MAG: hypothetical protein ABJD66_13940, partial [Cellulophaga sp.]